MMLVGLLWAMFAPVGLLLIGLVLDRIVQRFAVPVRPRTRRWVALLLPFAVVAVVWWQDAAEFERVCADLGTAQILETRHVDGVFLDDPTANSFGMRYLHDEGFDWIEARSIYRRDGFTRYDKSASGISNRETDTLTASVTVESRHTEASPYVHAERVNIFDRQSGRLLATAANAHFNGGRAHWLLGAWGSKSCPNPATQQGSADFNRYYHLAKLTLRDPAKVPR
jgi:hypothetical protein